MGLISDVGAGAVAVDTAIFVYLIEEHPQFLTHILPLFKEADEGRRQLVTSELTLLEVLVVPYRAGDRQLAERYEALLNCEPPHNFGRQPAPRHQTRSNSSQHWEPAAKRS